jgi:hypothetical protein
MWFQCNRSITDQVFCICQILEKKWEYNDTVHQQFIDFKKAYDSVWRKVLYNILIDDYITKLCRRQAENIHNHENENVRNIGQGKTPHRKHKGLKLGSGHLYDRSSV